METIYIVVDNDGDVIFQIKNWLEIYAINELRQFYFSVFFFRLWIKDRQFFFTTNLNCFDEYSKVCWLGVFKIVVKNYKK